MILSSEVKSQIREFEAQVYENTKSAQNTEKQKTAKMAELDALEESMSFRERRLRGWFGGDKDKVTLRRDLKELIETLDEKAGALSKAAREYDQQAVNTLDQYLRENDEAYKTLVVPKDAAEQLKASVDSFMGKIRTALSEIDDAQSMETMDMFTKSKAISFMSYAANSDASSAIDAVKRAAPAFQAAVQGYAEEMNGVDFGKVQADVGDGLDLFVDFAFDGFDFMSMFTLAALGSAESDMKNLRSQVGQVDEYASTNLDKANAAVSSYIQQARQTCAL